MVILAKINLWGKALGAILWNDKRQSATLEFEPGFSKSGWDVSPLKMPLQDLVQGQRIFAFPTLAKTTFKGLPGLVSDSLPDRYGNNLLDAWIASQARGRAGI